MNAVVAYSAAGVAVGVGVAYLLVACITAGMMREQVRCRIYRDMERLIAASCGELTSFFWSANPF